MTLTVESTRFRDLISVLGILETLHEELCALLTSKIEAMRRNDLDNLQRLSAREQEVAARIREREGFRRQLMDAIGDCAGWPKQTARALSLSQLASRVVGSQRRALLSARTRLRDAVARVAKASRLAGEIARTIVDHLRWVFESVQPRTEHSIAYTDVGARPSRGETLIVDTLG